MNTINYEKLIDDLNKLLIEVDEKCDKARKRDKRQAEALRNEIKTYVAFEIARLKNELEYVREPRPQIPPLLPIFPDIHFSVDTNSIEPPKAFSSQEQQQQLTETQPVPVPVPVPKRKEEEEVEEKPSSNLNDNDKEVEKEKEVDSGNKGEEDGIIYPSTVASFSRLQEIEEERKENDDDDDFLSLDANNDNNENASINIKNEEENDDDFLSLDANNDNNENTSINIRNEEENENENDDDFLSLDEEDKASKEERKENDDDDDFLSLDKDNNNNNENVSINIKNEEEKEKENDDDDDDFLSLSDDDDDFLSLDEEDKADKPTGQIDFVGDAYKEMRIANKEVVVPIEDSKGNSNKLKIRLSEHTEEVVRSFLKKYGPTKKYVDDLKGKLTPSESSERGITLPFEVGGKTVSLTTSHESVEEDLKKFFEEDNIPDDIVGSIVEFVDAHKEKAFKIK